MAGSVQTTLILIGAGMLFAAMLFFAMRLRSQAGESSKTRHEEAMRRAELEKKLENLVAAHTAMSGRLEQLTTTTQTSQAHLTKIIQERLENVSQNVNQRLADQSQKTGESLGKLNERLAVIDEAQKNITELSGQVVTLQDILSNKQARGAFGEIQLNDIVSAVLPPSAYQMQATLPNAPPSRLSDQVAETAGADRHRRQIPSRSLAADARRERAGCAEAGRGDVPQDRAEACGRHQ